MPDIETDKEPEIDALRRALLLALPALGAVAAAAPADAQDAVLAQPGTYHATLENHRLRVLDFISRPGMGVCGEGIHSHPAHLTVLLTPAKTRIHQDGKTFVASNQQGDVFWSEAVTHEVENISGNNVRALIIELKPTLGLG